MASVFAAPQKFNGGFRADGLKLVIAGSSVAGMAFQNVQFSFTQSVSLLYELGSNNVYYVGGRAQGTMSVGRIIGPARGALNLINNYGDLCNPRNIAFNASAGCSAGAGAKYQLKSAVLQAVGGSINAQDVVINEQLQFMFIDMDYS